MRFIQSGTLLKLVPLMLLGSAGLRADVVLLSENFDDISTLTGNGWTLSNQSTPAVGVNPGWFQGEPNTFAARSGAANSYISANYLNASVGGNVRNWLILPQLTVGPNTVLTFYTSTDTSLFPGDVLTVQVAAAGSGTYNTLLTIGDPNSAAYPTGWTKYSVNVGGAVPANVDIALVYSVQDTSINGNVIGIDDLSVVNVTSAVPEPGAWLTLSVMLTGVALRKRRQQKEGV